ncbi:unnamed protein product [Chilo suppressalis]|uniref:Uncharacterized protein n=1 Tax=Chilo suppressalis TaxID=168631 RepID=A0ABN8AZM5_CHISP|nr:unnamed protein product [Chilo suppressalis]
MLSLNKVTIVQTITLIFALSFARGQDRKINATLYPGCQVCTENDTLVYIRAEGAHNTIHQLWDFTGGMPLVILTVAGVNSTMNITWDHTTPVKFSISEQPKYSFATAIDKLYEYDDIHDNGYIDEKVPKRSVDLWRATWWPHSMVLTDQEVMVQLRGHVNDYGRSGTIDIKLDMLPFQDYAAELPHLIHTANSTLLDVSLVNFTTSPDYNASRYALNLLMVSQDSSNSTMTTTVRKSLDDEHTPGIFEIVEVESPRSSSGPGAYVQFRPVAYRQRARDVASSTRARPSVPARTRIPEHSTLRAFYRGVDPSTLLVQNMRISFGEPGDGFYAHHNYTAWSASLGYGRAPVEGFSALVVGIVACGLGAPALLLLLGGAYACASARRPPAP